ERQSPPTADVWPKWPAGRNVAAGRLPIVPGASSIIAADWRSRRPAGPDGSAPLRWAPILGAEDRGVGILLQADVTVAVGVALLEVLQDLLLHLCHLLLARLLHPADLRHLAVDVLLLRQPLVLVGVHLIELV